MPKQKGPVKMEGFIDGKIYYKMGNEYYVRSSSAPNKTKLEQDPSFKSVKDNYHKFGAASSIGSCFKKALGSVMDSVSDNRVSSHITSLFSNVIHHGKTNEAKTALLILPNRELFIGFQFKEEYPFDSIFKAHYSMECKKNRKEIILNVPAFDSSKQISKVTGATHYRLLVCFVYFSDYFYDELTKKYIPNEPPLNKLTVPVYSEMISINGKVDAHSIKAKLQLKDIIPDSVGILTCIGIEFYQEVSGHHYPIEQMNCMKIGEVF